MPAAPPTAAPHDMQNLLSAAIGDPQAGHASASGAPQSPQNRAAAGFVDPHAPHTVFSGMAATRTSDTTYQPECGQVSR